MFLFQKLLNVTVNLGKGGGELGAAGLVSELCRLGGSGHQAESAREKYGPDNHDATNRDHGLGVLGEVRVNLCVAIAVDESSSNKRSS